VTTKSVSSRNIFFHWEGQFYNFYKTDGSLSDTAVGQLHGMGSGSSKAGSPSGSIPGKASAQFVGLNKKSSSTSQLSATGESAGDYTFYMTNKGVYLPPCSSFLLFSTLDTLTVVYLVDQLVFSERRW